MDKILKQQKIFANKYLYENNKSKATSKPAAAITKDDEDFPGTAQVEALLNDIKARAIEMVNEQSPSVSNLIANTVTETSFDADPILKHVKVSSPGYTFDSLDNIDKRKANDPNVVMIPNKEDKHNISARSLKEDAFPIAENGEDRHDIMKKLKKVYKNVKNKVSKGYRKGVETAKSTVKCKTKKINHDVTKAMGKPKSLHVTKPSKVTQKPRNYDTAKTTKKMKKTQSQETTSASTIDDFALITMYEQILAKTYQDNAMKMPTTSNKIKFDKIISKRNPETLSDLSLKEDIKRIYDDGENIPEIDYGNDILPGSDDYLIDSNANSTNPPDSGISVNNEDPVKDTSYEGLSNKIHYNDYVNGYKNYLKFQKEQANTNFSNLVKYQAHRHHKVEDIGKYILDKIPQIPKINRKRFLDDMDMDEQDISTNSNDSWFKKHFYMFSDSQQKKYHTSETVKFKDSVIARKVDTTGSVDNMKPESNLVTEVGEEENTEHRVDLDELSRALENTRVGILEAEHDQQKKYHTSETDEFKDLVFAGKVDTTGSVDIMKPESNLVTEVGEEENTEHNLDELSRALENTRVAILEAEPELNNIEIPEPVKDSIKERRNSIKEKYSLIDFKNSGNDDVNTDNRFRRNAKITKQDNEIPKQTTLMYKNDITKPHKKDGFVSLVTRPTAIVNLHKTNVKESKIKKLLNKLHFHRCNRKKLKEKRHCSRVQRFNPLKKIKNMFSPKPLRVESKAGDDYELMASHIETFKPVKYEKIPNMNELKSQVPNISGEELIDEAMVTEPKNEVGFEVTTKMFPELDGYTNAETMNYGAISTTPFPTTPEFLSHTRFNARTDEHGSNEDIAENDDIIKVKIKEQSITLDNNIINQSTDDLKYSVPTSYQYKIQDKNYEILNNTDEKQLDDDIKAKFISTAEQISYITEKHIAETVNPVADKIKPYNYVDDYNYQYKETYPNQKLGKIKQYFQEYTKNKSTRPYEEFTSNQLFSNDLRSSNVFTNDKTYPDYFNDLVVWNHDILNYYDKGSISTSTQFTTPDLKDMEKQLYEMGTMNSTDNGDSDNEVISISPDSVREYFTDTMKVDVDNNEMGNLDVKSSQGDQVNHIVIPTKEPKEISFFNFRDSKEVSNKFYTSPHGLSDRGRTSRATGRLSKGVKNSIKTSTRKLAVPITKMNKQPEQFYDTPVAMKNDQFEKFLKDNQLDVGTVTIPMPPLPEISETGTLGSQINILTKNTKLTNKGTSPKNVTIKKVVKPVTKRSRDDINELVNNAYPEKQIKYLKDLEEDNFNDYADINNKQKRPRADYNTFTDDGALFGNEKYDKIKDKLNSMVFNNKPHPASNSNQETITNPDNNQNDDLELTIIDFDDGKAANGDKFVTEPDLKALFKDSTKKSSDQNNAIAPRTQIKPMELGYKDKHGNLPQRVQISAHSYKYDVSFNVPQKANRESDISTITINEYFDNIKDLQWTRNSE